MVRNSMCITPHKLIPAEEQEMFDEQLQMGKVAGGCCFSFVLRLKDMKNKKGEVVSTDAISVMPLLGPEEIGTCFYTAKFDLSAMQFLLTVPMDWIDTEFEVCGYHFGNMKS